MFLASMSVKRSQLQRQRADDFEADVTNDQDHHYVPIFFLEAWCGSDGKLITYSRRNAHAVASSRAPRGTGYETNLYSLERVPTELKQFIEEQFMTPRIDTPAAVIVEKIRANQFETLTNDERSDFARFLLSLRARHPDAIELAKNTGREELIKMLARDPEEYVAAKNQTSPSTLVEWVQEKAPQLIETFGLSNLPALIANDKVAERVWSMPWWIHDLSAADLLLSDRPCLIQGSAIQGECLIILPISPTQLFFACNQTKITDQIRSTRETELVKAVNKISVSSAAHRVFGTGRHHLPLVEKYLVK
jgi:hypothetical protein